MINVLGLRGRSHLSKAGRRYRHGLGEVRVFSRRDRGAVVGSTAVGFEGTVFFFKE